MEGDSEFGLMKHRSKQSLQILAQS